MTAGLDREAVYDILDRLNALEVDAHLPGVVRAQPQLTATKLKEELTGVFDRYRLPLYSKTEYAQIAFNEAKRKLDNARRLDFQRRPDGQGPVSADIDFWKMNKVWTVNQDNATYAYDFNTETFNVDQPLCFDGEIRLSEYRDKVEYFSDSTCLSLPGTLRNLLAEAERRGLNHRDLAILLHQFIGEYYPEQKTSAS